MDQPAVKLEVEEISTSQKVVKMIEVVFGCMD